MKLIFLMIMLTTMLFSSEKQIIVGSFLQEKYALNSLVKLNKHILSDDKLAGLINKNSIEVELKKIGQYHTISLYPFNSYVQLLRTLRALEVYYDDAYVLDNGKKVTITQVISKKVAEESLPPVKVEIEKPKEVTKQIEKIEVTEKKDDFVEMKKDTQAQKIQKNEQKKDYIFEIVLVLFVLLGVGFIIFKTSKRKKKDIEE